jgi:DNA-binding SARP family transcriptional activator
LWARYTEDRAAASLRSALWRLRQVAEIVNASPRSLALADDVSVDVWEVRAQTTRLLSRSPCRPDDLCPATLTTELLPDWFDDWVLLEREQLRLTSLYALESICDQLLTMGRHAEASVAAMAAVHSEPLRESAHRALIRVCLAEGNASEALRQYHAYATLLRDELDLVPSELMRNLVSALSAAGRRRHD